MSDIVFTPPMAVYDDMYFIHADDQKNCYIHFVKKDPNTGNLVYKLDYGVVGAALWNYKAACAYIELFGYENLKPVKANDELNKIVQQNKKRGL